MNGGIYSDQHCEICGKVMRDNGRNAVSCPSHKRQVATRLRVMMKVEGEWIRRRFNNYDEAQRFLTGLRFKLDEGSFDARDYKSDNPMGFTNLAEKWLEVKKVKVKRHSWDNCNNYIQKAIKEWGNRNVKEIMYGDIESLLFVKLADLSSKSRANASSVLHDFFGWLRKQRILRLSQLPEMPEVPFDLAYRKTLSSEDQEAVLDEVRRISWEQNPRVWIGIRWLSRYFSIRPGELLRIKESEIVIDGGDGYFVIPHPKEKRPKIVPMIDEDVELVKSLPRSFPEFPFFRHFGGVKGCRQGQAFGEKYLYKWWKRACGNLGIRDVDLYGGTRHSTVIALGSEFTPEQLKAASFHSTNRAFERYFRVKPDDIKIIYGFDRKNPQQRGKTNGKRFLPLLEEKT